MNMLALDHLAVACETLAEGAAHVEAALGVALTSGGVHPEMGTHNCLLSLGPKHYFEVIAADPDATRPDRPRWFNLDNFAGPPRLTNWILRTDDMDAALAALPAGFGPPIALERGAYRWRMAVPQSGILPWDGWAPAIIQWDSAAHPAPALPEQNLRLASLVLHHPQAQEMAKALAPLMPRDTVLFAPAETPRLSAVFHAPHRTCTLT